MTTMTERPVIQAILDDAIARYGQEKVQDLLDASERWLTRYPERSDSEWADAMVLDVLSFIDETAPHWTFVASRIYAIKIYADQKRKRGVDVYTDFAQNVQKLVDAGLYSPVLVEKYTAEELEKAGTFIEKERDELFTYIGLKTFVDRYVAVDYSKEPVELPQERWLVIALTLMQDEAKERRMEYVREAYWAMSSLYMTVATPTLANAGKTHGQLSSCFIDTVDDSLQGIYDSNTDVANLSKFGAASLNMTGWTPRSKHY